MRMRYPCTGSSHRLKSAPQAEPATQGSQKEAPHGYRGSSLIRNHLPLGPYSKPLLRALRFSYERGTPVSQSSSPSMPWPSLPQPSFSSERGGSQGTLRTIRWLCCWSTRAPTASILADGRVGLRLLSVNGFTHPSGHLWRDEWIAPSGPLSVSIRHRTLYFPLLSSG